MSSLVEQVKQLRETTGAGMMDCKKALVETNGNFDEAIDWLRTKGLAAASKKASRVAAEGLVSMAFENNSAAIIEVNSETDFVALNEKFQQLVEKINKIALTVNNFEELTSAKFDDTKTVLDEVAANVAIIGENINLRRMEKLEVQEGVVAGYIHNAVTGNLGKIAVLVALESKADRLKLNEIGRKIAMHIAATRPESLDIASLKPELIERERNIFAEQARASGKPESIIEKMIDGRIRKFYEEAVLLEQIFIIDGKNKVSDFVAEAAKECGAEIKVKAFARFTLGEGIEQEQKDFAAEVAAMSKH